MLCQLGLYEARLASGAHTVCHRLSGKNWKIIWANDWTNKMLYNNEKELFFKALHRALPVKGLPNAVKLCARCGNREVETLKYVLCQCQCITYSEFTERYIREKRVGVYRYWCVLGHNTSKSCNNTPKSAKIIRKLKQPTIISKLLK
jgi:hypothetical protein